MSTPYSPSPSRWQAFLNPNSPRYATWKAILGTDEVPVIFPLPRHVRLGDDLVDVYQLNLRQLLPEQTARLQEWIADAFDVPLTDVAQQFAAVGFPIRAEDLHIERLTAEAKFFL